MASLLKLAAMSKHIISMALIPALVLLAGISTGEADAADAADASGYARSIANWQQQREASLKGRDGWLNLAGLHWLEAGTASIGSSLGNDIVVAKASVPPRLGMFVREGDEVGFRAESGVEVFSDGALVTRVRMLDDAASEPTTLTHGTLSWHIIRRMQRFGVRVRDYEHPALGAFAGLEFYAADPAYRVQARFNAYAQPRKPVLTTVVEALGWNPTAPGTLEFELGGEALSLEAYESGDRLFLIFADLTTGETTYPSGRYLYADKPGADAISVLDFNKAYSPPCAYTDFATCPLPTRRNRMAVAIEAGEKYARSR